MGESIGRALDVDLFEITTTTESGELGAGVTIGQQIGERVFFKLRQEFGDRNLSEFVIEYQIASFLRFQGSAAPETSGSANRIRDDGSSGLAWISSSFLATDGPDLTIGNRKSEIGNGKEVARRRGVKIDQSTQIGQFSRRSVD